MNDQTTKTPGSACTDRSGAVAASATNPGAKPDAAGEHPVGVGLGAIGAGAAAGAAGGAIAGPVGAVIGAAAGAVVGGLAGKAAAEAINPEAETKHWRDAHAAGPNAHATFGYEEYAPAYRYGWESFDRSAAKGQSFESIEPDLNRGWDKARGTSHLAWDQARGASRDAWKRVQDAANGRGSNATN